MTYEGADGRDLRGTVNESTGQSQGAGEPERGEEGGRVTPPPRVTFPPKAISPPLVSWENGARFFSVGLASVLYLLSALSILYGMAELIGPVLAQSGVLRETLPCIGALNVYELALLGVLLAIVLFRKASADAVSLTVLAALFLVATGMALDTVANDHPPTAAAVAASCFGLAVAKLALLRKHVVPTLAGGLFFGACAFAAWNFMTAPFMAALIRQGYSDPTFLRGAWQTGWLVMLAGAVLMFGRAARAATGSAVPTERAIPFLRTAGMGWIVGGLLLAAGAVHQYALTYVFDVPWALSDYLPLVVVVTLLVLELLRNYGVRKIEADVVVASIPAAFILCAAASSTYSVKILWRAPALMDALTDPWLSVGILWRIPVLLAMMAVALCVLSLKRRRRWLLLVALAYALVFVLVLGATTAGRPRTLNWQPFGASLALALLALGLALREPRLVVAAVLVLSFGVLQSVTVELLGVAHQFTRVEAAGLFAGTGVLLVSLAFPRKMPPALAILAACVLALCTRTVFDGTHGMAVTIAAGTLVAGLGALTWFRLRNAPASIVLLVPLARTLYVSAPSTTGWHYVVLSFLLLAIGAIVSLRRGRMAGS